MMIIKLRNKIKSQSTKHISDTCLNKVLRENKYIMKRVTTYVI